MPILHTFQPFNKLLIQDVATLLNISYSSARKVFDDIRIKYDITIVTYKHFIDFIK